MASNDRPGHDPANLFGWVAATSHEVQRRRMLPLRLTAVERETCADELAEQYALGRLDDPEFGRRMDLLHSAVTHADLQQVFYGLPAPSLYSPAPRRRGRWRWVVFVGAVWMAVPFVLLSLALVLFGREIAALFFGAPALVWVAMFWRWASRGRGG